MASRCSSLVVVLILVALGALLADAAGRPINRPEGDDDQHYMMNNADEHHDHHDRVQISPSLLSMLASPLDTSKTAQYAIHLRDGTLADHSQSFCQDAKLECRADIVVSDPTLSIWRGALADEAMFQQARDLVDATQAMHFGQDRIAKGNDIMLPKSLRDSTSLKTAFLPQALAEKMPLTSARMPELLKSLNIPQNSNMAAMMIRTVAQCEAQQEQSKKTRKCVTSLEDMTNFVATSLPEGKRITALERSSSASGEGSDHSQDTMWKVMDTKTYERAVVCRNSVFPFAVFECHDISKSGNMRIINVEMQGHDGSRINEVAACHEASLGSDHSVNNPSKAANSAETRSACHWVTDSLIWAPTN